MFFRLVFRLVFWTRLRLGRRGLGLRYGCSNRRYDRRRKDLRHHHQLGRLGRHRRQTAH